MPLKADKEFTINGVKVYQYFLTQHNPNKISMPTYALPSTPIGVTIHNTESISTASNTTPAEQYTRATINNNMGSVRVHFYVDDTCAWQNLPLTLSGWHAADGNGDGNRKTIAFEVIGNSKKAEENAAKLAAYYLKQFGKDTSNGLFTHTHWLNVRDGIKGNIDYLNTRKHPYKWCPVYILPHWSTFKSNVQAELDKLNGKKEEKQDTAPAPSTPTNLYRIRKTWEDTKSQIGAYSSLDNAKKSWKEGYYIFDPNGKIVYPTETPKEAPKDGVAATNIDVTYRVYVNKNWLPEVKNTTDYAGVKNKFISCLAAEASKGTLKYRVHRQGGGWLGWITKSDIKDFSKGYAGIPGLAIDAIQMELTDVEGYTVRYRVAAIGKDYYSWVKGTSDYAGVLGKRIDRIQIEIVKK